ncbi:MAG: hypothetical protein FIB08_09645 [Candidatus Methanoperedens sp.]|nr:hypothetical protein [Candidatus Methanoperedens sp.]
MIDHYPVPGFGTLKSEILDKGLCTGCSICTIMCRFENLVFEDLPVMKQECSSCQLCNIVCPRAGEISQKLQKDWEILDRHAIIRSARSTDEGILKVCQDGGVTTSLLWYALSRGLIDGAVVSGVKDLKPVPIIASTYQELVSSAGVRYSPSPTYQALLSHSRNGNVKGREARLGLVGTPCQILALRNMQVPDIEGAVLEPSDLIKFNIGLFCMEQFDSSFLEYLKTKIDMQNAKKFKMTGNGLNITFADGSKILVENAEIRNFVRSNCRVCVDFTSKYADISVGSAGSPTGWTTVIIRSDAGRAIYSGALRCGHIIENQKSPNHMTIERLSKKKIGRDRI